MDKININQNHINQNHINQNHINQNHINRNNNINNDIFIKKELNYDRIKKIVKKSKKSKQNLKENNFKIIKFILSDFNHKIKRTIQFIFNL
jgi:hypothetical protein